MALTIDPEECVVCGACEPVCPNQAISRENTYVINAKACTECVGFFNSPQCIPACPVDCIHPVAKPRPPQTVKRAKLYQQVVGIIDRPDTIFFK